MVWTSQWVAYLTNIIPPIPHRSHNNNVSSPDSVLKDEWPEKIYHFIHPFIFHQSPTHVPDHHDGPHWFVLRRVRLSLHPRLRLTLLSNYGDAPPTVIAVIPYPTYPFSINLSHG